MTDNPYQKVGLFVLKASPLLVLTAGLTGDLIRFAVFPPHMSSGLADAEEPRLKPGVEHDRGGAFDRSGRDLGQDQRHQRHPDHGDL